MAVVLAVAVVVLGVWPSSSPSSAAPAVADVPAPPPGSYRDDRVLVGFEPGIPPAVIDGLVASHGAVIDKQAPGIGLHVLAVGAGRARQVAGALNGSPFVRYAELDAIAEPLLAPNDPDYCKQWHWQNDGFTGQLCNQFQTTPGADVDAERAWAVTTGSQSVVVGVVDSGVAFNGFADLAPNAWVNPGVGGCPAGTHGYDGTGEDCDPTGGDPHGSNVAAVLGARGNNGIGGTGMAWEVSIMGLRGEVSGALAVGDALVAADWALTVKQQNGVNLRALNMSFATFDTTPLRAVLARAAQLDVLVVTAAGNNSSRNVDTDPVYPCSYDYAHVVCLTGSTVDDGQIYSYGPVSVDLAAPASAIFMLPETGYSSGTSLAAPMVAGTAALILSREPHLSALEVKARILDTVDLLPSMQGKSVTGGRLNACRAVGGTGCHGTPPATTTTTTTSTTSTTTTAKPTTTTATSTTTTTAKPASTTTTSQPSTTTTTTTGTPPPAPPNATESGYWMAARDGGIFAFGDAPFYGAPSALGLKQPIVDIAATPSGRGYWLMAADGGIFAYGDARFHGSTGALVLNRPIVGMAPTPSGAGYWLVASDGGIFAFGDARFFGSTGAIKLAQPIVGMATAPRGDGYWLVAADGGMFAFGPGARFHGSTGSIKLARPIVGMAPSPSGAGYWLVASDGGIFAFGDARFHGSTGHLSLVQPIVRMAATRLGDGYWLVASDGGIFAFGSARFYGSTGSVKLNQPIADIAPA